MNQHRWRKRGIVLFAGGLVSFSLPPWGWWPLAFIGIALAGSTLKASSHNWRSQFGLAAIFATGWFAPGMAWMWFLTPPGYLISFGLFAIFHGVAAAVCARTTRPTAHAVAHTLAEALRFSFPFGGVPLASLAISQASSPLATIVRVGGPLLLTFVVFQIGFLLARINDLSSLRRNGLIGLGLSIAIVIAGAVAPHGHDLGRSLHIALVQGGGPQGTLAINTNSRDVVDRHLRATRTIKTGTNYDLVIWPENVIDVASFPSSNERNEIAAESLRLHASFLVGITEDFNERFFTNAQIVVNPDGSLGDRYDKVRRVPFGEFVPLRGALEAIGAPVDRIPRDAKAGTNPAIVHAADTTLGVVISWEVFFAGRANEGVEAGATMLVNPTNGSSYTWTILQTQQIASSRLRALETGRWIAQVSPTGFSGFISPDGNVFDRTGVSEQQVVDKDVQLRSGRTLYSRIGDRSVIVLLFALFAVSFLRKKLR